MSLVSTFTQAEDGLFYSEGQIALSYPTWFICYDDREPIELVFQKVTLEESKQEAYIRACELIKDLPFEFKHHNKHKVLRHSGGRVYKDSERFTPSWSCWLDQTAPLTMDLVRGKGRTKEQLGSGCYYIFKKNEESATDMSEVLQEGES